MKNNILTMLFTLAGLVGMAQTNQPLPPDAQPLTALTYLSPSDSTVWLYNERSGLAINVGVWADVVELFNQKWSNTQIDSAITANLAGYVPTSRTINGKALTGNITLNADDVGASQPGDNVSDFTNDAGYITAGDIPADAVTSVNGMTGAVTVTASDVGLGNVDNTSDANKPISTATQAALDLKEDKTNKVTSLSTPNNTTYPTTQAVKTAIDAIEPPDVTGSNGIQVDDGEISPVYGTTAGTVAQGNDSRINNGQTAFGWGDYRQFGLGSNAVLLNSLSEANDNTMSTKFLLATTGANTPFSSFGTGINVSYGSVRSFQLWFGMGGNGGIQFRTSSFEGVWAPIQTVWHSGNFTPPETFTRTVTGLVPSPGGSGSTRYLREDGTWAVPDGGGGGGTATDLSIQNRTATTLDIGSSTGNAATVPIATTSLAGLLSATDKVKLNGLTSYSAGNGISISSGAISATFGTSSGTVAQGNDSRINNGQTAYDWGNHAQQKYLSATPTTSTGMAVDEYNGDLNDLYSGFGYAGSSAINKPGAGNGHVITIRRSESVAAQIYAYAGGDQWVLRKNQLGAWSPWYQIWHSGNFTPSDYLATSNFTWSNLSGKPSTFAPSAHSHNASDINAGTLAIARIPTGTTGSTVALGNHTHTFAQITSKPTTLSGYGITDAVPSSRTINGKALSANVTLTAADVSAMPTTWTITAGNGLTGGGNGTANRTLTVGAGDGITVNATNVAVNSTVVRTSGNQTIGGTKTFSSPVVVANATNSNHAVTLGQLNVATANGKPARLVDALRGDSNSSLSGWSATNPLGQGWWSIVPANSFLNTKDAYVVKGSTKVTSAAAIGFRLGSPSASRTTITSLNPSLSVYVDVELTLIYENDNLYYTLALSMQNGSIPGEIINGVITSFDTSQELYFNIDANFQSSGSYTTGAVISVLYPHQTE